MDTNENVRAIFEFIKALDALKTTVVTHIDKQLWHLYMQDIPCDNEYVFLHYRDTVADTDSDSDSDTSDDDIILSVKKPDFSPCPQPNSVLLPWLEAGWERFDRDVQVKQIRYIEMDGQKGENENLQEAFESNRARVQFFEQWSQKREVWRKRQQHINHVRQLFNALYQWNLALRQDSETQELMIGNGILMDTTQPDICHPVLMKRVRIDFDAKHNEIALRDTNAEPELYVMLLASLGNINFSRDMQDELLQGSFHPLDRNDAYDFLERILNRLCPESKFLRKGENIPKGTVDWLFLQAKPVLFVRKKIEGLSQFVDKILENIDRSGFVPSSLQAIAGNHQEKESENVSDFTIEQQLAAVGGEDIDILLAKPANQEQLAIAQQIEKHDAVLVQGPPGTGKTHTIANLMGHFLAKGQRVLVTSYTKKALSVVKEKLPEQLRSLCVSLLDDTNRDMETSINGITAYMSDHNSFEMERKMSEAMGARREIMQRLSDVRKKIYHIQFKEYENLVYNGESVAPIQAARFVADYAETYSHIIPGEVDILRGEAMMGRPLPLNISELVQLYQSNEILSLQEEQDFERDFPDPNILPTSDNVERSLVLRQDTKSKIQEKASEIGFETLFEKDCLKLKRSDNGQPICLFRVETKNIQELQQYLKSLERAEEWTIAVTADGKRTGYRERWETLCNAIDRLVASSANLIGQTFGKRIDISAGADMSKLTGLIQQMQALYEKDGSIGKIKRFFNGDYDRVDGWVKINGNPMASAEDCMLVLAYLAVKKERAQCALYWDDLMGRCGLPNFTELDCDAPEAVAQNFVPKIRRYLDWYDKEYSQLQNLLGRNAIDEKQIVPMNLLANASDEIRQILLCADSLLPTLCDIQMDYAEYCRVNDELIAIGCKIQNVKEIGANLCILLADAWTKCDIAEYASVHRRMIDFYNKRELYFKRKEYLRRLETVAPEWATNIRMRSGIHGESHVPENIEEAWRWKQYSAMLREITAQPFEELQRESHDLSASYRKATEEAAEYSAWYHLLRQTEQDGTIQQYLVGWRQTMKRIGKGTGKRAPRLRAEARKLMKRCQTAVPAWIMTIGTALNSLDPRENQFDVVIVDEASQADITALTMLYIGKKIIIVGDDKQVSPLGVGQEDTPVDNLIQKYLVGIPVALTNFTHKTSLYDIGQQICTPLMLREHFRCVPDIIEFSNFYRYDNKIKPLREESDSKLLPAVVEYRVDGKRNNKKENLAEADTTVALIQAMLSMPEYQGKSIGMISLLGNEQSQLVTKLLLQNNVDMARHDILCGDAAQFQGDERDVIILNMVDSNDGKTPLMLRQDDKTWQRYNVAVSRAKDQLWVIHSLALETDLKDGDIRRYLLGYVSNPHSLVQIQDEIAQKADSPFEEAVAKSLVAHGYNIVQQWPVGKYRIDMVIRDKKIAIECDGERYHSGAIKVREDMERQTILERLGWRFIRLRGSEYFSNPEKAMERVVKELKDLNVYSSGSLLDEPKEADNIKEAELVIEIKRKVAEYLSENAKTVENRTTIKKESRIYKRVEETIKNREMSLFEVNE